jgi:RsmE family RNA methyltransferase
MNLILFEPHELNADKTVHLDDRRSRHIIDVLGSQPGDRLKAGIVNGPIGSAEILSITKNKKSAVVILLFSAEESVPQALFCDLIVALPRPIMLKRILVQAAELGVRKIFLINANRVEKSFFQANLLKEEKYRQFLLHGLEQAKDTLVPEVSIHQRFRPFVEDFLPEIVKEYHNCLVAHPETANNLFQVCDGKISGQVLLAIGPEGGWVDFEIDRFIEQGFQPFSLGERILRVETALVALLAQLHLLRGMDENS